MIHRKTTEEIAVMYEGGQKLAAIRDALMDRAVPGAALVTIEKYANELIDKTGGTASFKSVKGYRWATCLCVNEVVVHGIPNEYVLKNGDVLTIDIGLLYKGFHTDTASSKIVGIDTSIDKEKKELFLRVGYETLMRAIEYCRIGHRVGEISVSNQNIIERAGFSIVKSLVGHGVGHDLHEEPQVPNYSRGETDRTYQFQGGETIAIEPIYVMGNPSVVYENDDGWTITTRDRSIAAVFEHSVAITESGPLILTKGKI